MIDAAAVSEATRVLIESARSDTVGLWTVLWDLQHASPSLAPLDQRRATLAAIAPALLKGDVVAGGFVDRDADTWVFAPWEETANEALARIEREWSALGRDPDPGEIVWFVDPGILPVISFKRPPSEVHR